MPAKQRVNLRPCRQFIGNMDEIARLNAEDCDSLEKLGFQTETTCSHPDLLGAQNHNVPALT